MTGNDDGPWHVMLTAEQRRMLRRLLREEAARLGVKPDTEIHEWPKENWGRLRKMQTVYRKLTYQANYRAG